MEYDNEQVTTIVQYVQQPTTLCFILLIISIISLVLIPIGEDPKETIQITETVNKSSNNVQTQF